jgi:hypothetical protein
MTASQKFAEVLYANVQNQQAGGATAADPSGDDDVVDAEVVDEGGDQQSA